MSCRLYTKRHAESVPRNRKQVCSRLPFIFMKNGVVRLVASRSAVTFAVAATAAATITTAPATAATTATAITAAAPAAIPAATPLARSAFASFIHHERPAAALEAVECVDCRLHVGLVGHLHETEAARASGFPIHDYFGSGHIAVLLKEGLQIRRGVRPGQIAHIDPLSHPTGPLRQNQKR